MTEKVDEPAAELADIPLNSVFDAPMVYADVLSHVTSYNGIMRLVFSQVLADPPEKSDRGFRPRVLTTIAMPASAVESMVDYLSRTLDDMRAKGILSAPAEQ